MTIHSRLLCLAAITAIASCTSREKKDDLKSTFVRINEEVLQNSKAYSTLKEATSTIGHRMTGSENGHKAEEYAFNKFKEYGFVDVQYQEFEVEAWSRGEVTVTVDGNKLATVTLAHSPVKANVDAELVFMGNGLEANYDSVPGAAKGKIVLVYLGILQNANNAIFEGTPKGIKNLHRSEKTGIAIRHGAIGVIFFNTVDNGVLLTGTASVTGALIPIPAVCIGKEDGFALVDKLKAGKRRATIVMANQSKPIRAKNVVATIKGTELPGEKIVIGGHLDSWDLATGAIDNGIGSFAVLDIARAFQANQLKPRRTVEFVMFMGEEQGLLGSRYRVNQAVKDSSIDRVKYMMNLDMSGNPIGINAGGTLTDSTFFPGLGATIHAIDTVFSNQFTRKSGLHSDHQPFMLEGVPILGVISNLDKSIYSCYHSDCDKFDLVNETHIRNTARFGTMILYGLANADRLPAQRMDSEATRQLMIDNNLKEPLILAGDWKWER